MVNYQALQKAMLIILISIASPFLLIGQEINVYEKLGNYRKFSLMLGPTFYQSAQSRITSGTMAPENLPIWGISGGFEVDIRPEKQWSFVTGLVFAKEPSYHIRLNIKQEDIPSRTSHLIDKASDSYVPTLSLPLLITYKLPLSESQFLEFRTGGKVKIFPSADILYSLTYQDDISGTRELFRLTMENTEKFYFGSFLFGAGITTLFNSFLIKTNLLYTLNFQDTYRGEYAFANLSVSGSSTGTYALSGNNVSLMFSIAFKKPENRIKDYY